MDRMLLPCCLESDSNFVQKRPAPALLPRSAARVGSVRRPADLGTPQIHCGVPPKPKTSGKFSAMFNSSIRLLQESERADGVQTVR